MVFVWAYLLPGLPANSVSLGHWVAPSKDFEIATNGNHGVYFRKEFDLKRVPISSEINVVGLGHFHLFVNGHRISNHAIDQPWSQYNRRIYFTPFNIQSYLHKGKNVVGISVGSSFWHETTLPNGRYYKGDSVADFSNGEPILINAKLTVHFADKTTTSMRTDRSWQWAPSPLVLSHEMGGEDYDARLEIPNWDKKSYSGNDFHGVRIASNPPKATLARVDFPSFQVTNQFQPVKIIPQPDGSYTYVFGQNSSNFLSYQLKGQKGATVTFTPSETMTPTGKVEQLNLWGGHMLYRYTLRGSGLEEHTNEFQYFGSQFVNVSGAVPKGSPNPDHKPEILSLVAEHVQTDNSRVGYFSSSNPVFNGTERITRWAMANNMSFVLTDCPTREKMGWLECSYLLAPSLMYQWNCQSWFVKIARDIRDEQLPNGCVLTTAPTCLQLRPPNPFAFTVEWGAAAVLLPWDAYQWYGSKDDLAASYPSMLAFDRFLKSSSPEGIAPGGLGDWYDYKAGHSPGESLYTPTDLSATATYALCLESTLKAAHVLHQASDESELKNDLARVTKAFWSKFYDPSTGTLKNSGSVQTGVAMAYIAHLIPKNMESKMIRLVVNELAKNGYQQTSGDIGHAYFIRALAQSGNSDVLFRVYERTGLGSYGGILKKGLTTLPESWDARSDGGNSLDHAMLGHIIEWYYGWVAGIRQAANSVGWKSIVIGPNFGNLHSASARFLSPSGAIKSAWQVRSDSAEAWVTIPAHVRATFLPPPGWKMSGNEARFLSLRQGKSLIRLRRVS